MLDFFLAGCSDVTVHFVFVAIKKTKYSMLISGLLNCWEADFLPLDKAKLAILPCFQSLC